MVNTSNNNTYTNDAETTKHEKLIRNTQKIIDKEQAKLQKENMNANKKSRRYVAKARKINDLTSGPVFPKWATSKSRTKVDVDPRENDSKPKPMRAWSYVNENYRGLNTDGSATFEEAHV